jgi:hypothetical protein
LDDTDSGDPPLMTTITIDTDREVVEISDERLARLRIFNLVMGVLHLVSGTLMVVLGNDSKLPTSTFNLNGPPAHR